MLDRLRPLLYHLFVAGLIGGLWVYADARRATADGDGPLRLPPADPELLSRIIRQSAAGDLREAAAVPAGQPADSLPGAAAETSIADPEFVLP